jgi:hypothetical protein
MDHRPEHPRQRRERLLDLTDPSDVQAMFDNITVAETLATLCAACRTFNLRPLALHACQLDDDRPPLRHLARDGREHAIKLLDALNAPEFNPWTLVDARWTPKQPVGVTPENESDA